jgi:quinol monooxygenase YgiN
MLSLIDLHLRQRIAGLDSAVPIETSGNFVRVEEGIVIMASGIAIIEVVDIKTSPDKREELRRALSSLSGPTEAEPGCTSCQLYQPLGDPSVVRVESHWKTQSDFFRHLRSDAYKKLLVLMELGCEPPTVEFYTVSELRGLSLVKAARELLD